ncbi:MAG: hypothetical protein ACLPYB_06655 [Desulfobaccales bacterium]
MGEPELISFTYKELAAVLIKHQGIHEGIWSLTIQFAFNAGMTKAGPAGEDFVIAANVAMMKFGLQKIDQPTPISVDAAEANPLSKA